MQMVEVIKFSFNNFFGDTILVNLILMYKQVKK